MIEVVLGRRPPYGNTLQNKLRSVVRIQLRLCPQGSDGSIAIQFVLPSDADLKKVKANESLGTGFVHCLAYAAPSGQLLLHRRFPSQNPQDGLLVNLQNNKGLVVHLIHEDLVGFDDLQVIGDVQIAPRCPVNNVHSEGTTVQPARSKRQKVETLRGHEATFAMARARQGTQIETLSSSFASPLPSQGRQNAFQMTPMTQRAWVTQSCGHGSTPNQLQRFQFTSGSPMQTTMQPSVPPAMPRVPCLKEHSGAWRPWFYLWSQSLLFYLFAHFISTNVISSKYIWIVEAWGSIILQIYRASHFVARKCLPEALRRKVLWSTRHSVTCIAYKDEIAWRT